METHKVPKLDTPIGGLETSSYLGIHINTLYKIPSKDLPFFRIGTRGDRRYYIKDILAYIDKRKG